ncbi:MAG TPA: hypothetical protein VMV69_27125, partial [Pirellulales bacterium]|nr:hypothetical protein [Pirellulales bacterium]
MAKALKSKTSKSKPGKSNGQKPKSGKPRAKTAERYVYSFGPGGTDGDASMRNLLGGKGANLA